MSDFSSAVLQNGEEIENGKIFEGKSVFASLAHVSKIYGERRVLNDVSLKIFRGEILCVLGESGGGKTTLLNMLASLVSPDEGTIDFYKESGRETVGGETSFKKGGRIASPFSRKAVFPRVSYAFQEDCLLPNLSALGNLRFVGGEEEYCRSLLTRAELSDKENSRPRALSGGEKQRVSLLRAFAAPFDLLLADEPFSALDVALKQRMISLFSSLWREKQAAEGEKTAVLVTHSVKEAISVADAIVVLKNGKIAEYRRVPREEEGKDVLQNALRSLLTEE